MIIQNLIFTLLFLMPITSYAAVEPDYKPGPLVTTPVFAHQGAAEQKADMDFIAGMRPHHAGALTMSDEYLKDKNASNEKLRSLSRGIVINQKFEIEMLDRVETLVSQPLKDTSTKEWRQVAEKGLAQKQKFSRVPMPTSFGIDKTPVTKRDVEFAKAMVIHHEGALVMADDYLKNPDAKNPYLRLMCLDILKDQKMEIALMNKIIGFFDGNPDDVKIDPSMVHGMDGMMHGAKSGSHHGHH